MDRCDFLTCGECGCQEGQCAAIPTELPAAPVFRVSARTQMICTVFACVGLAAVVIFVAAPMARQADHDWSLRNQEQIAFRR